MSGTVNTNFGEYVGVSDLYIAAVSADTAASYTAGSPEYLAPAASVAMEPSVATKVRYYDNKAYYTTTTEGETKVTLVVSGIDLQVYAKILGKHYDTSAKRLYDTGDAGDAPYFALGFKTDVEGGEKFFWFLKGKFAPFKEEAATRTNDIDQKTTSLEFNAINTIHDKFNVDGAPCTLKRVAADSRLDNTVTAAAWFSAVQKPDDYSAG